MKLNYRQAYGIFKVNRVKGGNGGMKEIEILKYLQKSIRIYFPPDYNTMFTCCHFLPTINSQ